MTADPAPPRPQGLYLPARIHNGIAYTAGMTPRVDGVLWRTGLIGQDVTDDNAQHCVVLATRNALAAIELMVPGTTIEACLTFTVYLACAPGFQRHAAIADAGSSHLRDQLGDAGLTARAAVGVATLPGGSPAEVQLTAALGAR